MSRSKNLPFVNRKITFLSSPLTLLVLSACGGGGSVQTGPGGTTAITVTGNAVKGPLNNAWVFLDYNDNGVWDDGIDSARVRTDSQGAFALSATTDTYTIVATTDQMTTDTSSGAVFSGVTMSAPSGAQVVTPATTLIEEAGIAVEQIAEVLGLPDGVDPLSFNPYASGVNASDALAVEKASQQIMSVVNAFAGAAEGAGASEAEAFEAALTSVVEVVKVKATNLTNANASAADKTLDLTDAADLALVKAEVVSKVAAETSADTTAFNALADDTTSAVKNVNAKIATVMDLSSDAAKNTFSTTQVLADQTKQAAEAEVQSAGSGSIDFTDTTKVDTAAANKAPTDITLNKSAIAENANPLVIGTLSTTDSDQTSGVLHTYKIAELAGTDHAAFSIDTSTGELSFKSQPDFETKSSYSITILSTDEGGKTYSKSFTISVTDVNENPTVANAISDQTIAEDSTLNFQFASDVFSDVDAGDSLTYTATLSNGSALPSWLSFNAATRTFSGTPTNSDVGALDVTVTATDGDQATATDTFTLTVINTNDAPTVANAISDQTIAEDSTLNFQFASDVFSDVDAGDSLTYTATLSNGSALPSWLSFNAATRTFSGTPTNSDVGALDVTVTATDGDQAKATEAFKLSVEPITTISISTTDFSAEEGSSTGAFTLTRTGSTDPLTVNLQFKGTAQNGADYHTISQSASFATGQESLTLTVNPKQDTAIEGAEIVTAEILSSDVYTIANSSASLEIRDAGYIADGKVAPLNETFQLNSLPGADLTFYLNFLGGEASASQTVAPFSQDEDRTTFSNEELTIIQQIWAMVAEDWLPFNVNVTTEAPTQDQMWASSLDDPEYGIEMIIGYPTFNETHERAGEEGGFAISGFGLGGIAPGGYLPGFVKWKNAESNAGTIPTANGASHELGHMLGLSHDGRDQEGYDSGDFVYQPNLIPTLATTTYSIAPTTENNTFEIIARTADDLITLNSRDLHLVYTSVDGLSLGTEVALQPFSASSSANVYTSRVVLAPGKGPANVRIALYEDASADGFTAGEFVVQPTAVPPTITEDYTADVYSIVATDTLNTFEVIVTTKDDLAKLNARDLHFVYTQSDGATLGSEIELPDFAAMPGMVNTYSTLVTLEPSEDAAMVALYRDPDSLIQGYYGGHQASTGAWAPIMGVSGWAHSTWDKGEYEGATNPDQDDLKVIDDRRNVDYRLDDHADSAEFATTIVTLDNKHSTLFAEGIIERNTDEDWFTFEHSGGDLVLKVNPISPVHLSPNLKVGAVLYDASLNAIQVEDKYNPWLHASISQQDLAAGTYYLKIEGVGAADEMSPAYDVRKGYSEGRSGQGGYSDYGSLGKYTIESGYGTIAQFNTDQSHILDRSVPIEEIKPTSDFFGADEQGYAYWGRSGVSAGGGNGVKEFWSQGWENTDTLIPDEYLALHLSPEQGTEFHLADLSLEIWINRFANFIIRSSQDNFSEEHVFAVKKGYNALVLDLSGLDPIVVDTELRLHVTNDESLGPWFTVSGIDPNRNDTGIELNGYVVDVQQSAMYQDPLDEIVIPDFA